MLFSAFLHDQCSLQSPPSFSASGCAAPFFSNPCLQGWVSCTCEHENRVSEPVLRCCVMRARENNWDKPLLDDIIISLCHDCKILIHGHFELKFSNTRCQRRGLQCLIVAKTEGHGLSKLDPLRTQVPSSCKHLFPLIESVLSNQET